MALGIIGFYFSLFLAYKGYSSLFGKKVKKAVIEAPVVTTSSGEVPSIDSPEFATWIEIPGNIEKLFA